MSAVSELSSYLTTAENWWGNRGIAHRLLDHLRLSAFAVFVAAILALPPAVWLGHRRRGGLLAVWVVNIGRAVPSFAIIVLVLPFSLRYGFGLGFWPTAVALVLLALPPMFTNAYTGIRDVDAGIVEAARGMGMRESEVLRSVELPAGLPLIITGVRVSTVQVVATATLGAYVGFGGLGTFIVEGFASHNDGKLLTGAVLVAVVSLVVGFGLSALQRRLTPWTRTRLLATQDVTTGGTMMGDALTDDDDLRTVPV